MISGRCRLAKVVLDCRLICSSRRRFQVCHSHWDLMPCTVVAPHQKLILVAGHSATHSLRHMIIHGRCLLLSHAGQDAESAHLPQCEAPRLSVSTMLSKESTYSGALPSSSYPSARSLPDHPGPSIPATDRQSVFLPTIAPPHHLPCHQQNRAGHQYFVVLSAQLPPSHLNCAHHSTAGMFPITRNHLHPQPVAQPISRVYL